MTALVHGLTRLASSLSMTLAVIFFAVATALAGAILVFGMSIAGATAFYFVVWWIVLFVTLPVAICSQSETAAPPIAGTEPGAPITPYLRERAIATTFLADIVFIVSIMVLPLAGL